MAKPSLASLDRQLRVITILTIIPALGLGIPSAVLSSNATILGVALIPMAASVVIASLALLEHKILAPWMFPVADAGIAATLLAMLIPYWITQQRSWNISSIVLGCYATVPMLLNFMIHAYYTLKAIELMCVTSGLFQSPTCPHCNHRLLSAHNGASDWTLPHSRRSSSSKESYHPVAQADNSDNVTVFADPATSRYNDGVENDEARTETGRRSMSENGGGRYNDETDETTRLV